MTDRLPRSDGPQERKSRGAFFTPPEISGFIADWAIRSADDRILEPSCGEASFLLASLNRLKSLKPQLGLWDTALHGVELHAPSAEEARRLVVRAGGEADIRVADFFDVEPTARFDAVIGNPPYIRYQQFAGEARAKGLRAAFAQGVRLTGLASSWAAFTIHATQFLKPGGRLGLVLPAELLTVNYAAQVRKYLLQRFGRVQLVMFEELVFPGVLEEVVLLLAEGQGPAPCFHVYQAADTEALPIRTDAEWTGFTPETDDAKWTPALLHANALDAYRVVTSREDFTQLLTWGETSLGAVTGNNSYFTLTADEVRELKLRKADVVPVSPPGSRHLRGLSFSEAAWRSLRDSGARTYLFYPAGDRLSASAERYIHSGEKRGVHKTYKCRNRSPWWRVPTVPQPDLLLTYMDHDRPRLTTNLAKVRHLNSLYGVTLRPGFRDIGRRLLPLACLNSMTLLGAELVGRAYGGGLLKLEPTEADKLPVPSLELIRAAETELVTLRPQLTKALRGGRLLDAVKLVDRIVLTKHAEMDETSLKALREAREYLFKRRIARGKGVGGNAKH